MTRLANLSRRTAGIAMLGALLFVAAPALADRHHSQESGHPLRIAAYVLHPIGVVIDTVIFRPAHWVVHRADWIETLFGHSHEDY
jgi:uncharacterized membrane protein YhiD involved in acid resistance